MSKYDELVEKIASEVVNDSGVEKEASYSEDELLQEAEARGMEIIEKVAEYNETSTDDVNDFLERIAEEIEDIEMLKEAAVEVLDEHEAVMSTLEDVIGEIQSREEHVAGYVDNYGDGDDVMEKVASEVEDIEIVKQAAAEVLDEQEAIEDALSETVSVIEAREEHVANLIAEAGFEKIAKTSAKAIKDSITSFYRKFKTPKNTPGHTVQRPTKGGRKYGPAKPSATQAAATAKDMRKALGVGAAGGAAIGAAGAYGMKKRAAEAILENEEIKKHADDATLQILNELQEHGIDPDSFIDEL